MSVFYQRLVENQLMSETSITLNKRHQPNSVASGFEPVQEAFQQMQAHPDELGSALCIYHQGQVVVDLWAGHTSPGRKQAWQQNTVVSLFSAGKALTALCLLHIIDRGLANLDDPVVKYWPGFALTDTAAKSQVTLNHLLHHRAGLPTASTNRPGDVYDWQRMVSAMEKAPLLWPAGKVTAYHAVTFGHLVGEVIRRISGQMPADYFAEHFARTLQIDLSLRLLEEQRPVLASCDGYNWKVKLRLALFSHLLSRSGGWQSNYFRPCSKDYHPNSARWQNTEAPAITSFGSARGLARIYAMLSQGGRLNGVQVLSEAIVERIANEKPQPVKDEGIQQDVRVGMGLYFNLAPMADLGPNPNSFGHVGMGGVTAFADPDHQIGFGYVCNHLYQPHGKEKTIIGNRAADLAKVFYDCLE
ncbi:beta-lactamase [Methylophaga frappieri]|uniref:Beta-lactamase n=1 Tax=Methylophaga frappieri (strain ATCC BAA-2434 / DSM 25690 / JAM7) TaxID=754477 RepID=I1YJ83_METFJ|nr:EstA family serine hydrolase [Methylophaga frappieri]AFJ02976.1 beta-lactamase [Methylophaga frappieri]